MSFKDFLEKEGKGKQRVKSEEITRNITEKSTHKKKKRSPKTITYTTEKEFDFLKFYIIVSYYYKKKFFPDLQPREIEFLLFLYSEPPFTRTDFKDYEEMLAWNRKRLNDYIKAGYIIEYQVKNPKNKKGSRSKLFTLSSKTKGTIRGMYDRLLLRYKISERKQHNPLFRVRARSYVDKRFAKKIKQMNEGKFCESKSEDDYEDINTHRFIDSVDRHNESNYETLVSPKDVNKDLKQKKEV